MASTPTIRIDQATVGNGTAGQSRTDGVTGQVVTLSDPANASGDYSWVLYVPRGSSTTLSDSSAASPTYTPDITGNYLAFCTVDGVSSFSINAAGERVSTQGGLGVASGSQLIPTPGETTQFDSAEGWADYLDAFIRQALNSVSASSAFGNDNYLIKSDGVNRAVQVTGWLMADNNALAAGGTLVLTQNELQLDESGHEKIAYTSDGVVDVTMDQVQIGQLKGTGWEFRRSAGMGAVSALSDATTIAVDASLSNIYTLTIAGNRTLGAPTNAKAGQTIQILITQGAGGSHTLAYNAVWNFEGGTAPVLSTGAGEVDILTATTFDGTNWYATLIKDWS